MTGFITTVKKSKRGAFYVDIPDKLMKDMKIKPFMAADMKAEKKQISIFNFQKTRKIKVDLKKKTIKLFKSIMQKEGYGSLDETISNSIEKWFDEMKGRKRKTVTTYIYPTGFLDSKYILIDDYQKAMKKAKKSSKNLQTIIQTIFQELLTKTGQ